MPTSESSQNNQPQLTQTQEQLSSKEQELLDLQSLLRQNPSPSRKSRNIWEWD